MTDARLRAVLAAAVSAEQIRLFAQMASNRDARLAAMVESELAGFLRPVREEPSTEQDVADALAFCVTYSSGKHQWWTSEMQVLIASSLASRTGLVDVPCWPEIAAFGLVKAMPELPVATADLVLAQIQRFARETFDPDEASLIEAAAMIARLIWHERNVRGIQDGAGLASSWVQILQSAEVSVAGLLNSLNELQRGWAEDDRAV